MKKKNKKGFTLIELLAVIVILAVIALIAVPQVLRILNKSRLSAAEDSVYGIVKSAETYVSNFMLQNNGAIPSEDLVFNCNGTSCDLETTLTEYELDGLEKLEFKGTKPKSGKVAIKNNGKDIVANNLIINGFRCQSANGEANCFDKKEGSTSEIPTDYGYTNVLKIVYLDPTDLAKSCDASNSVSTTGTKTGCMKWYAYSEDSKTYTMILDHNTTVNVAYNSSNDNSTCKEACEQLTNDTTKWDSSLNPRLITVQEMANIIDYPTWTADGPWFFIESKSTEFLSTTNILSKYAWLYDYTKDCESFGCFDEDNNVISYWMETPLSNTSNYVWQNISSGIFGHGYADGSVRSSGIRPVITVEKSYIS